METERARQAARVLFDAFWRGMKWSRNKAYRWLAERLKAEDSKKCGFAFFDLETCNRVVEIIKKAQQRQEGKP